MDIYREIVSALEAEDSVILATIISTAGSTPASAFSKMLVKQNGVASVGTVGGGCMEGDVVLHANRLYHSGKAEIMTFRLNEDDAPHGLVCGGSLDVLIEPITKAQLPLIEELFKLQSHGHDCVIATLIDNDGMVPVKSIVSNDYPAVTELAARISYPGPNLAELVGHTYRRQETQRLKLPNAELILEPVTGTPSLVVFGGGHVSKFVSRIAAMSGFRVTIVDDREKYSNNIRFPEAVRTLVVDFQEAFNNVEVTSSTFLLIVTRGHEYDELLLEHAIETPASYIGMIGSKRKVLKAYEHLLENGVPVEQLQRVHAPVGIDLGAVTAEEIAVSIVAQLINVRRKGPGSIHDKSNDMEELLHRLEQRPVT